MCFDTGGYSIKGADGMLRMKKDMAGAATALSLAGMIMEADLPLRLELRLGCVENSIGEDAMRPLDILKTRRGLTVEVGNTDAEGRLVLCDLLAEASDARPDVLIDFATLTGAARTALGPDIAAMFCNDDALSCMFAEAAAAEHDPVWRLPLWEGYNYWLDGVAADLNNVSGKAHAGAVTAALFCNDSSLQVLAGAISMCMDGMIRLDQAVRRAAKRRRFEVLFGLSQRLFIIAGGCFPADCNI